MNNALPSSPGSPTGGGRPLLAAVGGNLVLASTITLSLIGGMVLALCLAVVFILGSDNPGLGLAISIGLTLVFNLVVFFLSPFLMDLTQRWLYQTRWVSLSEIQSQKPETAELIQKICQERQLKIPRLGIIDDQNPTAFTYGSLPNSARLVVSQGLFTYCEDGEVAAVYAHELGHIVHWDFAVMTLASTLVQICYLIYIFANRIGRRAGDQVKDAMQTAALVAYLFYIVGTYLLLYLSRTREYFADHFAAESTRDPNALARALVKIAYGIVEEGQREQEPSRLLEGTRALGIYDAKAATSTGTAYRISSSMDQVGRVFLWDMFNPWGTWMELNSTHPLTGKRVRALATYAEQLGQATEFDMARVIQEGKQLDRSRLYGRFVLDLVLGGAGLIGLGVGLLIAILLNATSTGMGGWMVGLPLIGFGLGTMIYGLVAFPQFQSSDTTDILTLMSDPYASPLRAKPARLNGELIGRGDAGNRVGSDLKLQDRTGLLFLRFSSLFGGIGNLIFGFAKVRELIGSQVEAIGWFRRGVAPYMDLARLEVQGRTIKSHPRMGHWLGGGLCILIGLLAGSLVMAFSGV